MHGCVYVWQVHDFQPNVDLCLQALYFPFSKYLCSTFSLHPAFSHCITEKVGRFVAAQQVGLFF